MILNIIIALVGLAVAANRATEVYKRTILETVPFFEKRADLRHVLAFGFSLLAGIVSVAAMDPELTLYVGTPAESFNPTAVLIVSGLIVGAMSNVVHLLTVATTERLNATAEAGRGYATTGNTDLG